jgi:outer membrane protein TolC
VEEVSALAMGQSPSVLVASFGPLIAEESIQAAKGEFDPRASASIQAGGSDNETTRRRSGLEIANSVGRFRAVEANDDTTNLEAGVGGKLATGLQYDLHITRSDSDLEVNVLGGDTRTDTDGASLSISQPLLKGFGIRLNRAEILKARESLNASESELYLKQENTVAEAMSAYWQLAGAYAALKVRESAVRTAEKLLSDTEQRNELGAASDLETLTSEAAVARRQNDLISALGDVGNASDHLKGILGFREGELLDNALIAPASKLPELDLESLRQSEPLEVRIRDAWARRPELRITDAQEALAALTVYQRRNARQPGLDLVGQIGSRDADEVYGDVFPGRTEEESEYWNLGIRASVPIGNRRARADYQSARLREEQIGQEREQIRTLIDEDLRRASRDVMKYVALVENARKTVAIEQVRFKAEEERYLFGASTTYHLIEVQDYLIQEETRLALAESQLAAAMANLQRAEGRLLSDLGLAQTQAETPLPVAMPAPDAAIEAESP